MAERDNICTLLDFELRILAEIRIKAFYGAIGVIYIRNNAFLLWLKKIIKKGEKKTP